jgi:DNA invertase Pin-like site-specific DNA recombinase
MLALACFISLFHITGHEIRLCPRQHRRPGLRLAACALKKAGCRQTFTDHGISGATTKRPALARCLKALEHGDMLTVWKLDRLGRSVRDLLNILHDIQARGVRFQSITEAIDTVAIDTVTPTGRAMLHMVALLAELERGLITERTCAGVKAAKRRGVKFGHRLKLSSEQVEHARDQIERGKTAKAVAALFRVGRTTLWRALKA